VRAVLAVALLASCAARAPSPGATDTVVIAPVTSSAPDLADASVPPAPDDASARVVAEPQPCGRRPLPDCPLQAWMKKHSASAMQAQDFTALAEAFEAMPAFAPDGFDLWVSIAAAGQQAAEAKDLDGTKHACKTCHVAYQNRYCRDPALRARPL
jgi:hypothetical protein